MSTSKFHTGASAATSTSKELADEGDDLEILKTLEQDVALFAGRSQNKLDGHVGFGSLEGGVDKLWVPASAQHASMVWQLADVVAFSEDKGKVVVARATDKTDDASLKYVAKDPSINLTGAPVGAETEALTFPRELVFSFDDSHAKDIDNAALLNDLNEPALLHLLRRRFLMDKIYTFTGDIVIAVNPCKDIPGLYALPSPGFSGSSWDTVASNNRKFKKQSSKKKGMLNSKQRSDVVPHIFEVAQKAYANLGELNEDQSILINGESGAGKTETAKRITQYLVTMSQNDRSLKGSGESKQLQKIEDAILQSSIIMEAFGNACTTKNSNSSRFGKFTRIDFNGTQMVRATTRHFLLEKSRIVQHGPGERNYHVFYQLVNGFDKDDLREKLGLEKFGQSTSEFRYLCPTGVSEELLQDIDQSSTEVDTRDYVSECRSTLGAMKAVGMTPNQGLYVWGTLAGILYLGNITFSSTSKRSSLSKRLSGSSQTGTILEDMNARKYLVKAAEALHVESPDDLLRALTTRTMISGRKGEATVIPLSPKEAGESRDALAKYLYSALMEWLVVQINKGTEVESSTPGIEATQGLEQLIPSGDRSPFIGLLDMFGFEIFERNSFEQLCVNYANEVLQKQFNHHVFVLEQQRYVNEGIDWQMLTFQDNQPLIDLFEQSPGGIFHQLDQQGLLGARGTDMAFVSNMAKYHTNVAATIPKKPISRPTKSTLKLGKRGKAKKSTPPPPDPKPEAKQEIVQELIDVRTHGKPELVIRHYVGNVTYDASGFLAKNNDALQVNLKQLIDDCAKRSEFLAAITEQAEARAASSAAARLVLSKEGSAQHAPARLANLQTVGRMFQAQIKELTVVLDSTVPHFIRCVKPNHGGVPSEWDGNLVLNQLRYLGVMETVRIRREGFPVRRSFSQIAERYGRLLTEPNDTLVRWTPGKNDRMACKTILQGTLGRGTKGVLWQCGSSKRAATVFLADVVLSRLDHALQQLEDHDAKVALEEEKKRMIEEAKQLGAEEAERLAKERAEENHRLQMEIQQQRAAKRAQRAAKSQAKLDRRRLMDELGAQNLAAEKRREEINNVFQVELNSFRKQIAEEQSWLKEQMASSTSGSLGHKGSSGGGFLSSAASFLGVSNDNDEEQALKQLEKRAQAKIAEADKRQEAEVELLRRQIAEEEAKFARRRQEWETLEHEQQIKLRKEKEEHEKELARQATATRERLEAEARALEERRLQEIKKREEETLLSFHQRLAAIEQDFLAKLQAKELEHRTKLQTHMRRSVDRMQQGEDSLVSLAQQQNTGRRMILQAQSSNPLLPVDTPENTTSSSQQLGNTAIDEAENSPNQRHTLQHAILVQSVVRGLIVRRRMEKIMQDRSRWTDVLRPNEAIVYSSSVLYKPNAGATGGKTHTRRGSVLRFVGIGGSTSTKTGEARTRRGSFMRGLGVGSNKTPSEGNTKNSDEPTQLELLFTSGVVQGSTTASRSKNRKTGKKPAESGPKSGGAGTVPRILLVDPSSSSIIGVLYWDAKQTRAIATSQRDFVIRGLSRETGKLIEWQLTDLSGSATKWVPVLRQSLSTFELLHYRGKLQLGTSVVQIVKQGHLLLRVLSPKKNKWGERFFVLKGDNLIWYRNQSMSSDNSKANRVRIDGETKVTFPMDEEKPNCFDVKLMHLTPAIWLRMHCPSNSVRNEWLVAICSIAEKAATQKALQDARHIQGKNRLALEKKVHQYRARQASDGNNA